MSESVLLQEFSTSHHEWYLENHNRLQKKYDQDNPGDWKREYIFSLAAWNAAITLLSDSQLANQERLVGEMQELRQQLKTAQDELLETCKLCHRYQNQLWATDKALLAPKDTPTEPKSAPEEQP